MIYLHLKLSGIHPADELTTGRNRTRKTQRTQWSYKTILFLLLALMTAFPLYALGENSDPDETLPEMETVVVTATRSETLDSDVAANVTVVSAQEIKNMPASTAAEVLQYVPDVYVEFNGGPGSEVNSYRIQGSETRHVAVYQDGVPLNQLANPLTDLNYLPVDAIDRIEIYKGAASSAWGSSLGGVINIITKEPDPEKPFAANARLSYGEFDTIKARANINGTMDRLGWLLSATHEESDGFIEHTDYRQDALYAKFHYDTGDATRLSFVYSYDEGRNADPVVNFPSFWDDIERERTYQRLMLETQATDDISFTIEGRHHRYQSRIDDVYPTARAVWNDYNDEIWGGSARLRWDIAKSNILVAGFDGDWGRYDWINYTDEYNTGNWALYANDTYTLGNFVFNGGLRYDDNKDFGTELSPSGGVVYHFKEQNALVRASVARGFSAPPAAWVHDPTFGNPNLNAETAVNYQVGGEIKLFKFLTLDANLFQADVKNLIRFDFDTFKYQNLDSVRRRGVEGSLSATFKFITLGVGGSHVDVRDKDTGEVIQDIPRHLYNVSALYNGKAFTHSLLGKYIDHNSSYPETEDKVFIFDYLLKYKIPLPKEKGIITLFGAVYNLFDTTYLYRTVWPKPGRWVEGGIQFQY